MKVLVTGATGHLGTNLVVQLCEEGRSVRAFVRPTSPRRLLEPLSIEWAEGDLLDPGSLRRAMRGVSVVFHAGAVYRMWSRDPEEVLRPILLGTRNVLDAAAAAEVERLVYVSTMGTVGFTTNPNDPYDETHWNTHSRTPYLRAKILAEQEVLTRHRQTGLPVVVVNPGVIIGPRFLRPTPSTRYILDFLKGRMPAYFQTGFSLVDAEDVARGLRAAERHGLPGQRYLLGGENVSMQRMFAILSTLTGIRPPRIHVPNWALGPMAWTLEAVARLTRREPLLHRDLVHDFKGRYLYVDSRKAQQQLGYRYLPAEETLRRTVEWAVQVGMVPEPRRSRLLTRLEQA